MQSISAAAVLPANVADALLVGRVWRYGVSFMRDISRDPLDLVRQTCGTHHQYTDGFMLCLSTMFSPIKDRDAHGSGFTHHLGDRVTIVSPALGALVNRMQHCDATAPWSFGIRALYQNLARRGLASTLPPSRSASA